MIDKLVSYLKSSFEEMKKVAWPTKKETYNYTILVIVVSLVLSAFLGALDYVFNMALNFIIQKGL